MESWLIQLFRRGYHKNSHLSGIDINCYWHTSLIASILLRFASKLRIIKILTGQHELGGNCYPIVFSSNGTLYRVRNFKGLHQISSRETQISRDISNCKMRSIKSQMKQMELLTAIQTGRSSWVSRIEDEKNSKGLMQNRNMGVGRVAGGRGRSIFYPLSSARTTTHLDPSYLEELEGKNPGQAKNHFGACKTEGKAQLWSKERGEWGLARTVLQPAELWPSSENRKVLCQVDSGSRNWSWAAESLSRAFQKAPIPSLIAAVIQSLSRGQDKQESCCETGAEWMSQVLPYRVRCWAHTKALQVNSWRPLKQ